MEKINLEEEARSRRVAKSLAANIEFLNRNEDDGRDEEFLLKLAKGLVVVFLVSGDEIFREGEPGDDMYFVKKGTVDILVNDMTVATINAGKFFGEVSLIANIPRTATAKATSTCMLYRLSRATFTKILDEFEDMRERIKRIYEERLAKVSLEKLNRSLTTK
ncbi:cyclic nucleotide-binding-like protein [Chytriomyces sp. MP71]|nr:cyclic nucleotide-binding-like protein [Chytriomyces sp. MP71]